MIYSPTKPGISTRIDWSDPLSQEGLVGCWLFNSTVNIARGDMLLPTGSPVITNSGFAGNGTAYYSCADASQFGLVNGGTIFFLGRWNANTSICSKGTYGGGQGWYLMRQSGSTLQFVRQMQESNLTITGSDFDSGVSCAVTVHQSGDTGVPYINGRALTWTTKNNGLPATCATPFKIGAYGDGNYKFSGIMKCLMIYNRALNANEIKQLHELTAGW